MELTSSFGENTVTLAKTYGLNVTGIDKDEKSIKLAQKRIEKESLQKKIEIMQGDTKITPNNQ